MLKRTTTKRKTLLLVLINGFGSQKVSLCGLKFGLGGSNFGLGGFQNSLAGFLGNLRGLGGFWFRWFLKPK